MSVTVYALRLKGDLEVRYIGQTRHAPYIRLASHRARARLAKGQVDERYPMNPWLENDVEAVTLAVLPTREAARDIERMLVEAFHGMGHRLFNAWLVPARRAA